MHCSVKSPAGVARGLYFCEVTWDFFLFFSWGRAVSDFFQDLRHGSSFFEKTCMAVLVSQDLKQLKVIFFRYSWITIHMGVHQMD